MISGVLTYVVVLLQQAFEVGTILVSVLYRRKLSHRITNVLAQGPAQLLERTGSLNCQAVPRNYALQANFSKEFVHSLKKSS